MVTGARRTRLHRQRVLGLRQVYWTTTFRPWGMNTACSMTMLPAGRSTPARDRGESPLVGSSRRDVPSRHTGGWTGGNARRCCGPQPRGPAASSGGYRRRTAHSNSWYRRVFAPATVPSHAAQTIGLQPLKSQQLRQVAEFGGRDPSWVETPHRCDPGARLLGPPPQVGLQALRIPAEGTSWLRTRAPRESRQCSWRPEFVRRRTRWGLLPGDKKASILSSSSPQPAPV